MTRFRVWAPQAARVDLVTAASRHPLEREGEGYHALELEVPAGTRYAFALDGGETMPDPRSPWQPDGVHGPSATYDPAAFAWTDAGWRGRPLEDAAIYELHVGTFSPEGTFDGVVSRLDHLVGFGVNAVELMPVAEFPGDRGWGYDGVDLYAPHHAYGGPEGLDRLVDACHARGLAVVMDVVYNHLGPDGNYLGRFAPYFTDRHRTPWGSAVNFDGPDSDGVREFVIDNALMWLRDHHIDGLRVDAVHAIFDASATHVLEELNERVDELEERLGRRLWVVAESDLNDPRVVRDRERSGWGFDAQWSDDLHKALHAILTGEHVGYYSEFGRPAELAKALRDVFVFDGRHSRYRRKRHGRAVGDIPGHRFLGYCQDHDIVGNRPGGERIAALAGEGGQRIAAAVVLTSPFVPMLFMGEEWAASSPFLYFTDHRDPGLGLKVTRGRRDEIDHFGWPTEGLVDPQSPEAFERSRLDWSELERPPHVGILEWYRALLALRRDQPALRDGRRDLVRIAHDDGWMRIERGPMVLTFNAGRQTVAIDIPDGSVALAWPADLRVDAGRLIAPPGSVALMLRAT